MKLCRITAAFLCALTLFGLLTSCSEQTSADTETDIIEQTRAEITTIANEIETIPPIDEQTTAGPDTEAPIELPAKILISEIMADNDSFVMGTTDDWVELYNDEEEDVTLTGYYLYRDAESEKKLPLDAYTIPGKGYIVIVLDEAAPFRLPKEGAKLFLCKNGVAADFIKYDSDIGNGTYSADGPCDRPTPGYPNTLSGFEEYEASRTLPPLYITEVMSSNKKYSPVDGNYYDFVELYNGGTEPIQLHEYYLSDKKSEPKKYNLPEFELQPGKYCVIYCSGLDKLWHAPFKISSTGEKLYLSTDNGVTDFINVPGDLKQNESYGRNGNKLVYMTVPTPGSANKEGYTAALGTPEANIPSGAYDRSLSITLSGEGKIYYTLDGTEPTAKSNEYKAPIKVDGIASIRAVCINGDRTSALTSFFYLVDINHSCPVLNVAIKEEYLYGDKGIINHINKDYEYESYVTMMDNGVELWSAPCGLCLHGNDSKKEEKQNFQLRFRSKYGLSKLDYPLFEDREYTTFNSLLLKSGSEDFKSTGFRDELCTTLLDGTTNLSILACRPVILYLNGEYRGIYWLRERYDQLYCAHQLGVSKDSINLLHTYGTVQSGTEGNYSALLKYVGKHDMKNEEAYKYVMDRIDAYSLMDWYICRSYVCDLDLANVRFYQSTEDDGKWHWCYFDLDWAFYHQHDQGLQKVMPNNGHHTLIRSLLKNPEFQDMFLKRYAELLHTVLNEQAVNAKIDQFVSWMEPEIEQDRAKYGLTVERWRTNIEKIRTYVKDSVRIKNVLASIKSYFGLSTDEMKKYYSDLM